jgi:succinate dehydrogenase flavin-adding protein (antitoxin of CptAB toxin-antitoxin module)
MAIALLMNWAKKKLVRPESSRGLLKNDIIFVEFALSIFIATLTIV